MQFHETNKRASNKDQQGLLVFNRNRVILHRHTNVKLNSNVTYYVTITKNISEYAENPKKSRHTKLYQTHEKNIIIYCSSRTYLQLFNS